MKRAVLFDLDNTLYDYEPIHEISMNRSFKVLRDKIKISKKEFLKLYKLSQNEIKRELSGTASSHNRILYFQRLLEKTNKTIESEIALKLYNVYWDTFLKKMKLRKGVMKTLGKLKEFGIKIAIVSDLTTNIQLRKISKLKINKLIDTLVTSEEAGSEKPHSIMFLLALNKLKINPENAIMVGDNTFTDIEGANAVGLDTALISNKKAIKFRAKKDYEKPNYYIEKISDILEILKIN